MMTSAHQTSEKLMWHAILAAICGSVFLSAKGLLVKASIQEGLSGPHTLMLRMFFTAPCTMTILIVSWRQKRPQVITAVKTFLLGFLGFYLSPLINFWGLEHISASLERILIYTLPIFVLLLSRIRGQFQMTRWGLLAISISYLGVILSCLGHDASQEPTDLWGVAAILLGCLLYAFFVVLGVDFQKQLGTKLFTSISMTSAWLGCLAQGFLDASAAPAILNANHNIWLLGLALGIFGTIIPIYLIQYSIRKLGPSQSSLLQMIGPLLTPIWAHIWLGEQMGIHQLFGFGLVLAGSLMLQKRKRG